MNDCFHLMSSLYEIKWKSVTIYSFNFDCFVVCFSFESSVYLCLSTFAFFHILESIFEGSGAGNTHRMDKLIHCLVG